MSYHSYFFFDLEPSGRAVTSGELEAAKQDLLAHLKKESAVRFHSYGTLGFKAGHRFMIHANASTPEELQCFLRDLMHTRLGAHLKIAYTLFGMVRSSQYNPTHAPKEAAWDIAHKYLIVYPFTKTTEWHLIPYDDRRAVMKAHVEVGRKHNEKIEQRLLYSYGIDDHEFVVSYYANDLEDFVQLVMDMRATESRRSTKNDLPIFTCVHMTPEEALGML